MTYTLAEIAAKFARLDAVPDEHSAQYLTTLRNLTQRHHLPPTEQIGRSFIYNDAAAITIRLAQIAAEFGLPRTTIDTLSRWLTNSGNRRRKVEGGFMGVARAEEAIERATAGETFNVYIVMHADRSVAVKADWTPDRPKSERVINASPEISPEIARFSLPASRLISEILPLLKA
ncbi:hypothetical protein [Paenirhodobacter populi]|uniref:Uncharacterized protein n=1 Tax=Paenirhodobacter populi TaxID=2306993 RepID=A0A443IVA5_9RHOB|nr:hypothetical protein [Sinirhodobacter populi]RWR12048.1 hypothetical protein D2T33_10195 [Sinirhodobacter populi]